MDLSVRIGSLTLKNPLLAASGCFGYCVEYADLVDLSSLRRFVDEKLPELRARRATVFVNVCGTTLDEYVEVSRILSDAEGVDAIELNISCPNIKEGGIQFGCSLTGTFDVV